MKHVLIVFAVSFAAVPLFAAAVFPPVVTKSFLPTLVGKDQISTMTITITNPNDVALTGASIIDNFPAGLVNAGPFPGTASTTCGGAFLSPGPSVLSMTNGTIPASGSCTITAPVLSDTPGTYANLTGHVFSSGPASLTAGQATLNVVSSIPALPRGALFALAAILAAIGMFVSARR